MDDLLALIAIHGVHRKPVAAMQSQTVRKVADSGNAMKLVDECQALLKAQSSEDKGTAGYEARARRLENALPLAAMYAAHRKPVAR